MWAPTRIFRTYQRQCVMKIKRIDDYITLHTNVKLSLEELKELLDRINNLDKQQKSMEAAWARHLTDLLEHGTGYGCREPGEDLKQLIADIREQVDENLKTSRCFYEMKSKSC